MWQQWARPAIPIIGRAPACGGPCAILFQASMTPALFVEFGLKALRHSRIVKVFSFWKRHGTNPTWDPFGFCHGKRGG
jgi:hypothetical protein